jgi:enterochelin esterase-like enzyme
MNVEPKLTRRSILATVPAAALWACSRRLTSDTQSQTSTDIDVQVIDFPQSKMGPQKAVVLRPKWVSPLTPLPLLIALHGRGESNHGLEIGAWGWVKDYWLDRAMMRIRRAPLDRTALLGISDDAHLAKLNGSLKAHPFEGLVVACPYTPDILGTSDLNAALPFSDFLVENLIPRLQEHSSLVKGAVGIDGVSLGGRVALLSGLARPDVFSVIGTLQAAIRSNEIDAFADRAHQALASHKNITLRILTSDRDPFRPTLQTLTTAMTSRGLKVQFEIVPGPHDYEFNRGPGAYEMLSFHDHALRSNPTSY